MSAVKGVEAAVRVFLEHLKIRGVVLDAVAVPVAENAQAGLLVHKEESAEVGIELLNAGTSRDEIVIIAKIPELHFGESFLEAAVIVEAICAGAHVGADDAKLTNIQII